VADLGVIIGMPKVFFLSNDISGSTIDLRRGSMILQGRVSNPSERGTGGRAPKAPREWVWGVAVPSPENLCIFYIKMVSFYAFPVIIIDTNCKPLREKTLAFKLQKSTIVVLYVLWLLM